MRRGHRDNRLRKTGGRPLSSVLALVGLVIVALWTVAPAAWAEDIPADFKLRLVSAPRAPDLDLPNEWVEIDAGGKAYMSRMAARDGILPEATIRLEPAAVQRIYDRVLEERFFELEPVYQDPDVQGGDMAEITVTANGRTHQVRTINIKVHAFDRITIFVDRELPIARRIQYNALHVPQYKAVDR